MSTIFLALLFPFVIILGIFLILLIRKTSQTIRIHNEFIKKLDNLVYKDLREIQFKSREISKQANKYIKGNSVLYEIITTILVATLPFKKLKNLIYLHKLGKKVLR